MCSEQGCKTERKPLICKWCSVIFVPQGRGPQKFCSAECADKQHREEKLELSRQRTASLPDCATEHCKSKVWQSGETHCKVCRNRAEQTGSVEKFVPCAGGCGKSIDRISKQTLFCDSCFKVEKRRLGEQQRTRTCEVCGLQFVRKENSNAGRACSRGCGWKLLSIDKQESAKETAARRENERASKLIGSLKPCLVCGKHLAGVRLVCDGECQALHRIAKRTGRDFTCLDCGSAVAPVQRNKNTCLPKRCVRCEASRRTAKRRAAKLRMDAPDDLRKRLGRTVDVIANLSAIIRAEGGTCPLCGLLLSEGCDPNHDRHVEFDHRLPRSRGGTDDYRNLRAICRRCNGLKSDFTAPELVLMPWHNEQAVGAVSPTPPGGDESGRSGTIDRLRSAVLFDVRYDQLTFIG